MAARASRSCGAASSGSPSRRAPIRSGNERSPSRTAAPRKDHATAPSSSRGQSWLDVRGARLDPLRHGDDERSRPGLGSSSRCSGCVILYTTSSRWSAISRLPSSTCSQVTAWSKTRRPSGFAGLGDDRWLGHGGHGSRERGRPVRSAVVPMRPSRTQYTGGGRAVLLARLDEKSQGVRSEVPRRVAVMKELSASRDGAVK